MALQPSCQFRFVLIEQSEIPYFRNLTSAVFNIFVFFNELGFDQYPLH